MRLASVLLLGALLPVARRRRCAVLAPAPRESAAMSSNPAYPETAARHGARDMFGEEVADPYRWLENDVRSRPGGARMGDGAERGGRGLSRDLAGPRRDRPADEGAMGL